MVSLLTRFIATRPRFETPQAKSLEWLARVHAESEAAISRLDAAGRDRFEVRMAQTIRRVACGPEHISKRGQSIGNVAELDFDRDALYDVRRHPRGRGTEVRTRRYVEIVDEYFATAYRDEAPPDDLVHVTCTGYASPNGAQKLVSKRRWRTRVTSAYHMGDHAALPALRIAGGFVATGSGRVDIAHTELCSLHLDPSDHDPGQLARQSLFADGMIRYCMVPAQGTRGLAVLATHERVLADSTDAMSWIVGDAGMQVTVAREVPALVTASLRGFVSELLAIAGRGVHDLKGALVAVHPGGAKSIDRVRDVLELDDAQLAASRAVLFDHGNMSSATLPHIWMRLLDDPRVPPGTLIPTLAFGPGLTVTGALLEKR